MEYALGSDPGRQREINEDCVGVFCVGNVFTVALLLDGMGGANGGKFASSSAYKTIVTELELRLSFLLCEEKGITGMDVGNILRQSAEVANGYLYDISRKDINLRGMGTTLVAAVFYGQHCCILNVGDSRGYYFSDGQVTQITKDQSYLQYLLDTDRISSQDIKDFSEKNVIMSAVGTEDVLNCDLYHLTFTGESDEYLLLSSDGLHGLVSEGQLCRIVFQNGTLQNKVNKMIADANTAGGEDNISAILIRR